MPSVARTVLFINIAHATTHYLMLVYPTAVLAVAAESGMAYDRLIPLATGGLVAYGLLSLPAGWLADRVGCRLLLVTHFIGAGAAAIGVGAADGPTAIAGWLLVLGAFCAIYHPVGLSLLVSSSRRLGFDLGLNGVCGNLGAALAAGLTAMLAAALGWRAAFLLPGAASVLCGVLYLALTSDSAGREAVEPGDEAVQPVARPGLAIASVVMATIAGGLTYMILTIALPKIIGERAGPAISLEGTGAIATAVLVCGAVAQIAVGRLIDRLALPTLFILLAAVQLAGLVLAALFTGPLLLIGLALVMAAIYGEVVVDDALVARFVPPSLRGKAFGLSYGLDSVLAGIAAPLIGALHAEGFARLLALTAVCGATLFLCALGFRLAIGGSGPAGRTAGAAGDGDLASVPGVDRNQQPS
ncbi:MFS transporter [Inquilinus limosus]|uniref:MFS transporter n=1 Tax=Inquilinus limosus TaxID=171674 RepID=UPI0009DD19A7|nr:MFS transporter [Inquilinus limosus]